MAGEKALTLPRMGSQQSVECGSQAHNLGIILSHFGGEALEDWLVLPLIDFKKNKEYVSCESF